MTAKQYINRLNVIRSRMQELMDEINFWHHKAYGVRAVEYKADIIQVTPSGDATTKAIEKYMDLEKQLLSLAEDFKTARTEILHTLSQVDNAQQRRILALRYVSGYSFRDISIVIRKPNGKRYTYDRVRALHSAGIKAVEEILEITHEKA